MNQKAGEILKAAREKKRMKQEDIAGKLGISSRQYQKYEEGEFPKFKRDAVKQLDEIFKTNLYELIYEQDIPLQAKEINIKNPDPNGQDYRDKYIATLEKQVALLEGRLSTEELLKEKMELLRQRLNALEHNQLAAQALTEAYQEYVVEVFWKLQGKAVDGKDILKQIRQKAYEKLLSFQESGISVHEAGNNQNI